MPEPPKIKNIAAKMSKLNDLIKDFQNATSDSSEFRSSNPEAICVIQKVEDQLDLNPQTDKKTDSNERYDSMDNGDDKKSITQKKKFVSYNHYQPFHWYIYKYLDLNDFVVTG